MGGGFPLSKWASSSLAILRAFPKKQWSEATVNLNLGGEPVEGVLGMRWNFLDDSLVFQVEDVKEDIQTRRQLASAVAKFFDPLGLVAPFTLEAKLIMRDACDDSKGWDDTVSRALVQRFRRWADDLRFIRQLKIPRWYGIRIDTSMLQLHVFADASTIAFGAVSYIRMINGSDVHVSLVMAKSRLAPKRPLTIPRMELQAVVTAVRLGAAIAAQLKMPSADITYWTDSTTVLHWISSTNMKFDVFIGNRIAEVLEEAEPKQWRYVPTELNRADDLSRGARSDSVNTSSRWFRGPKFLWSTEECWPLNPISRNNEVPTPTAVSIGVVNQLQRFENPLASLFDRCSRWKSIIRIVAWVLRATKKRNLRPTGSLNVKSSMQHGKYVCEWSKKRSSRPKFTPWKLVDCWATDRS
ncbi:hypothetical protein M514_27326 [Trichuris suis]|uniref:Pao retrotransposon peptidase n=1 Tax=Trichuris suis TaxID=68888 RepID=A0A085MTE4_9BILA|nr:hypothetical protein M514_27326 [Trichuris suis]